MFTRLMSAWKWNEKKTCRRGAGRGGAGAGVGIAGQPGAKVYVTGNTAVSWNNMHIIVGDAKLYASLDRYFTDMLPDINRPNYYRTTSSGMYKLYFFPKAAVAGTSDVPMLDVLNHVRCTGVAKGYGTSTGKTVVRIDPTDKAFKTDGCQPWQLTPDANVPADVPGPVAGAQLQGTMGILNGLLAPNGQRVPGT